MSDGDADRSRRRPLAIGLVGLLVLTPSILVIGGIVGPTAGFGGTIAVAGAVFGILAVLAVRDASGSEPDGEDTVWDAIPRWQYDGRHVESGGLSRDEQERALEEIETKAELIEGLENEEPHDRR